MKYMLVFVFVGCVAGLAVEPAGRTTLDEEELLHAMEARNEAIEIELEAAEEENKNVVEVAPEERHIGGGLGIQFLNIGAGASAGVGNGGVAFNSNGVLGRNFVPYSYTGYRAPAHFTQYSRPQYNPCDLQPTSRVQKYRHWWSDQCWYPAGARNGQGQVGFSGGVGFGGNYNNYGERPYYSQDYTNSQIVPLFIPTQFTRWG